MANYAALKAAVAAVIKTNGEQDITGNKLQVQLFNIINTLTEGYQFLGVATPDTEYTAGDANVAFLAATAGTYAAMGDLALAEGEVAVLKYNGTEWSKEVTGAATAAQVNQLEQELEDSTQEILNKSGYSNGLKFVTNPLSEGDSVTMKLILTVGTWVRCAFYKNNTDTSWDSNNYYFYHSTNSIGTNTDSGTAPDPTVYPYIAYSINNDGNSVKVEKNITGLKTEVANLESRVETDEASIATNTTNIGLLDKQLSKVGTIEIAAGTQPGYKSFSFTPFGNLVRLNFKSIDYGLYVRFYGDGQETPIDGYAATFVKSTGVQEFRFVDGANIGYISIETIYTTESTINIDVYGNTVKGELEMLNGEFNEQNKNSRSIGTYTILTGATIGWQQILPLAHPTRYPVLNVKSLGIAYFDNTSENKMTTVSFYKRDGSRTVGMGTLKNTGITKYDCGEDVVAMQLKTVSSADKDTVIDIIDGTYLYTDILYNRQWSAPLYGKNVVMLGDSITQIPEITGVVPNNGIVEFFAEMTGANVIRGAIGGSHLSRRAEMPETITPENYRAALDVVSIVDGLIDTNPSTRFAKQLEAAQAMGGGAITTIVTRLKNLDMSTVDIITIFAGTNDSTGGVSLGNDTDTNPVNNIAGAVNYIVDKLCSAFPHISVIFFTPCYRKYNPDIENPTPEQIEAAWADPTTWCDVWENAQNQKLSDFCSKIEDMAKLNHIPVCDMLNTMCWNKYNYRNFCSANSIDGTHPRRGFAPLARRMAGFVLEQFNRYNELIYK